MKIIKTFFRFLSWILIIALIMGGFYVWRSGIAESYIRENEELFRDIEYKLERAFKKGADAINGLIALRAEGKPVNPEEIEKLLGSGISGDGYSFDELYYPYYGMLSEAGKSLYREAYANAIAYQKTFMPSVRITDSEMKSAIEALFNDHPELFWLDTEYSYLYTGGSICVQVSLSFVMDPSEIPAAKEQFEAAVRETAGEAVGCTSDYEKEKAVHDAIIRRTIYNADARMSQSAYSALVLGETVCAGYSRAFQHILTQMGIPTYYCTGISKGDHSWNIVRLDDGYYNVDLTWDDSIAVTYTYFNRTDDDFAASHSRTGLSVYLPACNAQKYHGQGGFFGNVADWFYQKIPDVIPIPDSAPPQVQEPVPAVQDIQITPPEMYWPDQNEMPETIAPDPIFPEQEIPPVEGFLPENGLPEQPLPDVVISAPGEKQADAWNSMSEIPASDDWKIPQEQVIITIG